MVTAWRSLAALIVKPRLQAWLEGGGAPLIAGLIALAVYVATLAPTVTSEDAGELIAAAHGLGVPHPPGFPLWVLLVHTVIKLSPADVAWSANLSSGIFGAVCVGALVALGRGMGASVSVAVSAGLVLGFGRTFWSQSVIAEVYTLNAALLALALVCIVRWGQASPKDSDRGLRWAALFCGLGLANHYPLMLMVGPAFAAYAVIKAGRGLFKVSRLLPIAGLVTAPGLLYLYLLWSAQRGPALNWGEPQDLGRLWAHVARESYRSLELGAEVTFADKRGFLLNFVDLWFREMNPWILGLAGGLGVYALRRRSELVLLLGVIFLNSVVLLSVLRFRFEAENVMRVNEYYLASYVVSAAIIAMGLQRVVAWAGPGARGYAVQGLVLLLPLAPLAAHGSANDMSEYRLAEDFNRYIMTSLPPDAIYFPSGDYVSFPSIYLQAVEGLRPDILIANYTGDPSPEFKAYLKGLDGDVDPEDRAAAQEALIKDSDRPIIFASKSDVRAAGFNLRSWGLVYRAWVRGAPVAGPDIRDTVILRHFLRPGPVDDLGESVLADYHRARAEAHLAHDDRRAALGDFLSAERWLSKSKEGLNNLGSTMAEYGLLKEAERLYRSAAQLSDTYVTPRRNLAILIDKQGRTEEAITAFGELVRVAPEDAGAKRKLEALRRPPPAAGPNEDEQRVLQFEQATRAEPHRAPLWNNLGTAYMQAGRPQDALRAYLKATEVDPKYAMAHKHLAAVYREFLKDPDAAGRHQALYEGLRGQP